MHIIEVALPIPKKYIFDYFISSNKIIDIGCRVIVPFKKNKIVGITVAFKKYSLVPFCKIKQIHEVIDSTSLFTPVLWKILLWTSEYYHFPLGKLLFKILPKALEKKLYQLSCNKKSKENKIEKLNCNLSKRNSLFINNEFKKIIYYVFNFKKKFNVYFISQINKVKKNKFYNSLIEKVIHHNKQVLIMFPKTYDVEFFAINLKEIFDVKIDILHSKINKKEKMHAWLRTKMGENKIIIGTRSALLMPFMNLGLIIVEEEHDSSYKELSGLRYHARDISILYAKELNIPIVISSNNPSLETILNIEKGKYHQICFNEEKYINNNINKKLINVNKKIIKNGFSNFVIKKIEQYINDNKKIFIFYNKLGFASEICCNKCNWIAECNKCEHCYVVYKNNLYCNYCNNKELIPIKCFQCNSKEFLSYNGLGIEKIEEYLKILFPRICISRIDSNNINKKKINKKTKIFIGTTIFLKRYYYIFSFINLIIFIDIDQILFTTNFRAIEKFAQDYNLILNNINKENSKIIFQTKYPKDSMLKNLIYLSYYDFALLLLKERKKMMLPPFTYHAIFKVISKNSYKSIKCLKYFISLIKKNKKRNKNLNILGPTPALTAKKNYFYYWQIVLQHSSRIELYKIIKNSLNDFNNNYKSKKIKLVIDIDPIDI